MTHSTSHKPRIRVSIVEDDDRLRESLILLLEKSNGFRCVSAYDDAESALKDIAEKRPDIVLMDINLPGISGIECVRKLKPMLPETNILMLTVYEDNTKIFHALEAGASGYLLKMTGSEELLNAMRDVYNGGAPMSSQIARKVVQSFHSKPDTANDIRLTDREEEVLRALASGSTYKEIASDLEISYETVHNHVKKIYTKLHVRSRTEAVVKFLKR